MSAYASSAVAHSGKVGWTSSGTSSSAAVSNSTSVPGASRGVPPTFEKTAAPRSPSATARASSAAAASGAWQGTTASAWIRPARVISASSSLASRATATPSGPANASTPGTVTQRTATSMPCRSMSANRMSSRSISASSGWPLPGP